MKKFSKTNYIYMTLEKGIIMSQSEIDYFEKGLYEPIKGLSRPEDAEKILSDKRSYRSFCPHCGDISVWVPTMRNEFESAFVQMSPSYRMKNYFGGYINFGKAFECSLCHHELVFYFKYEDNKILKVGSYPSYKDIVRGKLIKEIAIPSSKIPRELSTALGLRAQGVLIGAYAYLRRIYETLIEEAAQEAVKKNEFKYDDYKKEHLVDRIKMLTKYLPECMQNNHVAYGILSKGIHELSEDDCESAFDYLYELIKNILEEAEQKRIKKIREKALSTELQKCAQRFNSSINQTT